MQSAIILLCLVAPFLLAWAMVVQRRRVNRRMRDIDEARRKPTVAPFEEVQPADDGLAYGHRSDPAETMSPPDDSGGEVGAVKAMQGRR